MCSAANAIVEKLGRSKMLACFLLQMVRIFIIGKFGHKIIDEEDCFNPILAIFQILVRNSTFQGVAFGSDFAVIGLITVQWASLKQNAIFIAMLTSFSQVVAQHFQAVQ